MDPTEIDRFRVLIEARRTELKELSASSSEARQTVTLDQQSVGRLSRQDAIQQQAMAKAQDARRANDLRRIGDTLARISEGDFGWCADCGEEIAVKRLEIDPMTEVCVGCAGARHQ